MAEGLEWALAYVNYIYKVQKNDRKYAFIQGIHSKEYIINFYFFTIRIQWPKTFEYLI